jgi:hypothetical protein
MDLKVRHLREVGTEEAYYARFDRFLRSLHLKNGIRRQEREVKSLTKEARAVNGEAAKCLEMASAALADAREELGR